MITVGDSWRYDRLLRVEKLVTLVFALVGRDRASWLRFDRHPDPADVQLWYCVDSVPYEMVPPPGELWPDLFGHLWRNTRLCPPDRPPWWQRWARRVEFPDHPVFGVLPVRYGPRVVEFEVLFFRGRAGEHISARPLGSINVTDSATSFLRRTLKPYGSADLGFD